MAEGQNTEPKTTEPQQTTDPQGHEVPENVRESAPFKAVVQQVRDRDATIASLTSRLDAIEADKQSAAKKAEEEELKKAGEWEKLEASKNAEIAAANKRADAIDRKYKLTAALADIPDPDKRELYILKAPEEGDINDYVEQLKKDRPDLWESPGTLPVKKPTPGGKSEGGGSNDKWRQVQIDLKSGDHQKVVAARKEVDQWVAEGNDDYPPGWIAE